MRKVYLDNIKWIVIVLVVLYHIQSMYSELALPTSFGPIFDCSKYLDVYTTMVTPWLMFTMFLVSGMSAKYYFNKHSNKEFIKSKFIKLFVPSVFGVLIFGWIHGFFTSQFGGVYDTMMSSPGVSLPIIYMTLTVGGIGQLWFLQLLWIFSMLLVLLRLIKIDKLNKYTQKTPIAVIILLVFLVWASGTVLNLGSYRITFYLVAYLIGYFILSNDNIIDKMKKYWYVFLITFIAATSYFIFSAYVGPTPDDDFFKTLAFCAYAYFSSLTFIVFMAKWGDFSNKFSVYMTKKSWGIYLFHYILVKACGLTLYKYAPNLPIVITLLIDIVVSFGGAILLYEIISRIPVLRFLLCGIYKPKKTKKKAS